MLTIFACPKAFSDPHISLIQRNAIQSWTLLDPRPDIILFGHDEGVGEIARELGVRHVSDIKYNEFGTPLLDDLFRLAQRLALGETLCYINADIILLSDFSLATRRVRDRFPVFLLIGRRWDLHLGESLPRSDGAWETRLREMVLAENHLGPDWAIDFFVFRRGTFVDIPPFAVGRCVWDNWLVWTAREQHMPTVDVTDVVTAVHQAHHYRHAGGLYNIQHGEEARRNTLLAAGGTQHGTVFDASYVLTPTGFRSGWARRVRVRSSRKLYALLVYRTGGIRARLGLRRKSLNRVLAVARSLLRSRDGV